MSTSANNNNNNNSNIQLKAEILKSELSKEEQYCAEIIETAITKDEKIRFIAFKMRELGCKIPETFFNCATCNGEFSSGFSSSRGITVCINRLCGEKVLDLDNIRHEFIHAYDHCKAKVSPINCEQIACTEIRASSLSGECGLLRELTRGNYGIVNQGAECVKRRSLLSLNNHPLCKGENGLLALNRVWSECYKDNAPFYDKP
eukprot:TRINITY_DN58_c5_g1_i1.p1 TRINITY_DN58_c5_g1~~TRINITY_DN58_c5_g1_i1.p1  ORF type:complete len:203 (+),score=86.62 TRINITY_DN58_c5_g1_i1:3-611(+)